MTDFEKKYNELKKFCEKLVNGVYCDTCANNIDGSIACEDCHRKMMMWQFPKEKLE